MNRNKGQNANLMHWNEWVSHLRDRADRPSLLEVLDSRKSSPLLWCSPRIADDSRELIERIRTIRNANRQDSGSQLASMAPSWTSASRHREANTCFAYECLAWADALSSLVEYMTESAWRELLDALCVVAEQSDVGSMASPLESQLFAGELAYLLSHHFPELDRCYFLGSPACELMSRGAIEMLDGEGAPHAERLEIFRPLIASWTRCQFLSANNELFTSEAQIQFEWAATQLLKLARFDGAQVLTQSETGDWCEPLFLAVMSLFNDDQDLSAARQSLPRGKKLWPSADKKPIDSTTPASLYSEWSCLASMRPNWKKSAGQFSVAFNGRDCRSEFVIAKQMLWRGDWSLEFVVDNQRVEIDSNWEETCWYEDNEANYLELEAKLDGGWRVQRQMLFAFDDGFLYLADALLADDRESAANAKMQYRCRVPALDSIAFRPAKETREGELIGARPLARVIPLALPEWRSDTSVGELANTVDGLQLTMQSRGAALYAPLFFDLNANRLKQEPTWRRLTVANRLELERADVATGFRVETGAKQWLIYRSLASPANRTVLGQNLVTEFLCGRFDRHGECAPIIEIE